MGARVATALVLTQPGLDWTAVAAPRGTFDAHAVAALTTMIITKAALPRRGHPI